MELKSRLREIVMSDCKDDGTRFVNSSRLDVIARMLEGSEWKCVKEGDLMRLYSRHQLCEDDCLVVISSHVDCVYASLCCQEMEGEQDLMCGTFDNSLTNTAVVESMLSGSLPHNVVVAFTGDEEVQSRGAHEVVKYLSEVGCSVRFVVVTDVTNVGWEHHLSFTIENDLNIDMLTAHSIVEKMKHYAGKYGFVHDALPDETWIYDEYKLPCLTFCYPICGEMHSDNGALARLGEMPTYCDAMVCLCRVVSSLAD